MKDKFADDKKDAKSKGPKSQESISNVADQHQKFVKQTCKYKTIKSINLIY